MSENQPMSKPVQPKYFVGIGASAGGLEAITTFFRHMPAKTGMTFIIVQHLSPDYKSMMAELIGKVTSMPVHVIEDGMEPSPDHIYLIPPNQNLSFFHGRLLLEPQNRETDIINLPIDQFLTTLAEDRGRFAIGVILSGTGSDGTRGCRAIKEQGGLVMAQTEASAKFSGMPRSVISLGLTDYVLSADEMPEQLLKYTRHPLAANQPREPVSYNENATLTRLFSLLRSRTKVDFSLYKSPTITRRIERRISVCQVSDLAEYADYLAENPDELNALYKELLIGVTNFYRDGEVFQLLHTKILPEYLSEHDREELRVWIAGCSTGEEAYTYCMLLHEICEQQGLNLDIKVFATDIDQDALNKASVGIYPESIVADLPRPLLSKYFIHKDEQYHISRSIREMVVFARHDLIKDPPFTNIDLVSCRNLLIYLEPVLQRRIFDAFNFSLKPSGLLVLGTSESLGDAETYFKPLEQRCKIFRSLGNRKPLLTSEHFHGAEGAHLSTQWGPVSSKSTYDRKTTDEARILESYVDIVAGRYVPFAMIVSEDNELYRVMGDSRRFLNPISGRVTSDIAKLLVKELSVPVATGLKKVFKSRTELVFTDIALRAMGEVSKVNILIKPFEVRRNLPLFAAIIVTEQQSSIDELGESGYDVSAESMQRIADLEQELQFTRESLQATIEEMETSNEELQATNEELLASNEELQSTNEELQSVNEELFTVNSEYQGKISELSELNADLHNFMSASKVVAVFLDMDLSIRRFTNNAKLVFNVIDHDVGRPFNHISHQIEQVDLQSIIERVLDKGDTIEKQVMLETGDWYKLSVMPYLLNDRVQAGIMIVMHEINSLMAAENEVVRLMRLRELSQTLSGLASWDWNLDDNMMSWSDNVRQILDVKDMSELAEFADFVRYIHPDDAVSFNKTVNDVIREGGSYRIQHRIITADNTVKWVEQSGAKVAAEHEGFSHLLGVMSEISEPMS